MSTRKRYGVGWGEWLRTTEPATLAAAWHRYLLCHLTLTKERDEPLVRTQLFSRVETFEQALRIFETAKHLRLTSACVDAAFRRSLVLAATAEELRQIRERLPRFQWQWWRVELVLLMRKFLP